MDPASEPAHGRVRSEAAAISPPLGSG